MLPVGFLVEVFLFDNMIENANTSDVILPIYISIAITILGSISSRGVIPVVIPTVPMADIHSKRM